MAAELKYQKLKRTEFQAWFGEIMEKAYPEDYENIRVTQGDGGLDGILIDSGCVFQVYAPREQSASTIIKKIETDFTTANNTMQEKEVQLKRWVFVHNDEGLTKEIGPTLAKLKQDNPEVKFETWTFERIWLVLERLSEDQLADLFGINPTESYVERLEFPAIRDVIEHLSRADAPADPDLTVPDRDKLEHNRISIVKADLLRVGRSRQELVNEYLSGITDPTTGEDIAEAFRIKYLSLKNSGMDADQIFTALWRYAGGEDFVQPDQVAAVTAVLAYYFSRCDIFENVPSK